MPLRCTWLWICPRPFLNPYLADHPRSRSPPRRSSRDTTYRIALHPDYSRSRSSPRHSPTGSVSLSSSLPRSSFITARKVGKVMSILKKKLKRRIRSHTIGDPQDFKEGSSVTDLLLQLEVPTLKGGHDVSESVSRSLSLGDDTSTVISSGAFAKEHRLPPRTSSIAPSLPHRHTAPPRMALPNSLKPNPLELNPPEPPYPPPSPPSASSIQPEGNRVPLVRADNIYKRNSASSGANTLKRNRRSVIYGDFETGSPFFPIIEEAEDIPMPKSESSAASGQSSPVAKIRREVPPQNISQVRTRLQAFGPLPLEMRGPLKIWQKYVKTGVIDVKICHQALDGDGNYTWINYWDLLNVYTFAGSFTNDIDFSDRVMDMLCASIEVGKASDFDTTRLIFTEQKVSSRLKRLVVDRTVDSLTKSLLHSYIKALPREFAIFVLEATTEKLTSPDWHERLGSPCRYHRHRVAEACYLRRCARGCDKTNVEDAKPREGQNSTQARFELDAIGPKQSEIEGTGIEDMYGHVGADQEFGNRPAEFSVRSSDEQRSLTTNGEVVSLASVGEVDMESSESSIDEAVFLTEEGMAKPCSLSRPTVSVVGVKCSSTELGSSKILPRVQAHLDRCESLEDGCLLPGSYPHFVANC